MRRMSSISRREKTGKKRRRASTHLLNSFQRSRTGDVMSTVKALQTGGFTPSQISTADVLLRTEEARGRNSELSKASTRPSPCKMKASLTLSLTYATVRRACTARHSRYAPKADLPMPALPMTVNLRSAFGARSASKDVSTPSKQPA